MRVLSPSAIWRTQARTLTPCALAVSTCSTSRSTSSGEKVSNGVARAPSSPCARAPARSKNCGCCWACARAGGSCAQTRCAGIRRPLRRLDALLQGVDLLLLPAAVRPAYGPCRLQDSLHFACPLLFVLRVRADVGFAWMQYFIRHAASPVPRQGRPSLRLSLSVYEHPPRA